MFLSMPEGPGQVFEIAQQQNKFSLGSYGPSLIEPTFWVVLVYGIFNNLQNFGIDQNYVQRYIASSSDREARKSLWFGALLYVPVSAVFFFIGTLLFVFYESHPEDLQEVRNIVAAQQLKEREISPDSTEYERLLSETASELSPSQLGDKVFPHFIGKHLPAGMTGLLIAAVFAAAMSTVSTSLNSSATLLMNDYYKRFFNRAASERQSMVVLYAGTLVWGALGTGVALALVGLPGNVLDIWWDLASILSGGMLGLFLLGMISRVQSPAAVTGVLVGALVIAWMVFSPAWGKLDGTVSVAQGTVEVTGEGIDFSSDLKASDQIEIQGKYYSVQSVAGDGQSLTLNNPFGETDVVDSAVYKVSPWSRFRSRFHSFLVVVIGSLSILLVGLIVGKLSSKTHA